MTAAGKVSSGTVGLQFADELAAIVSLPGEVAEDNAAALQVGLKALSEQGAGLGRAPGSKGEERKPLPTWRAVSCTAGR